MKRENENNNIEVKLKSEYYNNHDVENIQRREEPNNNNATLIGFAFGFLLFLVIFILIVLFVK